MSHISIAEKKCYAIAIAAAQGENYGTFPICHACHGSGLLKHPTTFMNVAECYVCNAKGYIIKKPKKEVCGCAGINTKTLSA